MLSTEAETDLVAPLVLEVWQPPDTVRVMQPIDDEWQVVEQGADPVLEEGAPSPKLARPYLN